EVTLFEVDPGPQRISLVRLCGVIARAAADIGRIEVEGEVHNAKRYGDRTYFTLRDRSVQISVTCPPKSAARCRTVEGERVSVVGRLEWTPNQGRLQLVAEQVAPRGEGAIAAAIAEARHRLESEGILSRPRRRIPRLPACIGVVCGTEAAVRADIESVVATRFPGYPIDFLETNVSGVGAAQSVVDALRRLDRRDDIEVIIVARGGGDAAQMLPFSDEALCRAIAAARTPVVSAIGHDGDRPLCDEVADLRCGTPSLAAAAVVPDLRHLLGEITELRSTAAAACAASLARAGQRLTGIDRRAALGRGIDVAAMRLERLRGRAAGAHPSRRLELAGARLHSIDHRQLHIRAFERALATAGALRGRMDALDPVRVLERGYAVVRLPDGTVVRDPAQVAVGTALDLQVARGRVHAVVDELP
ncbi:MAG TPA: exodeoxyribonuclease VII large subunit, partial [Acidimicrobiales bacterium]|nr:exodeoxyribonuclease VII large subunit [Acidimicrobiales bacterium]